MPYAHFTYTVIGHRVVAPTDVARGGRRTSATARLVLSACTPLFSAAKRLLVFARLTRTVPRGRRARLLPGGAHRAAARARRRARAPARRRYHRCSNPSTALRLPARLAARTPGAPGARPRRSSVTRAPPARASAASTRARSLGRRRRSTARSLRRPPPPAASGAMPSSARDLGDARVRAAARRARRAGATPLARPRCPASVGEPVGEVDHRVRARAPRARGPRAAAAAGARARASAALGVAARAARGPRAPPAPRRRAPSSPVTPTRSPAARRRAPTSSLARARPSRRP